MEDGREIIVSAAINLKGKYVSRERWPGFIVSLSSVAPLWRGCATRSLETDDLHKARDVCVRAVISREWISGRWRNILRNKSKLSRVDDVRPSCFRSISNFVSTSFPPPRPSPTITLLVRDECKSLAVAPLITLIFKLLLLGCVIATIKKEEGMIVSGRTVPITRGSFAFLLFQWDKNLRYFMNLFVN